MKIRITAKEGEIRERLPDIIRVIQRMAGERLQKATDRDTVHEHNPDFYIKLVDEYREESVKIAEKLRKKALADILKVIG